MATDKKSFLLYCDLIHTVEHLSDEDAGKVLKWVLDYVNDGDPEPLKGLLAAVCEPIKQQLKRDLKKYESIVDRNSKNGAKGGRPKKAKEPTGLSGLIEKPKEADSDTVTVTDNVSVKENVKDIIKVYSKEVNDCFNVCLNYFPIHLHPKDKKTWLDTIEKLNRIEMIPFDIIENIVKKTRNDDFWASNFLSITKLRKKNKDGLMYCIVFNEKIKSNEQPNKSRKQKFLDKIEGQTGNESGATDITTEYLS